MTKITFYQRVDGTFQGFHSQDHAGYSAEGQDIVCAAVSALVINFVNSLDELTDDHYQIDVNQEDAEIETLKRMTRTSPRIPTRVTVWMVRSASRLTNTTPCAQV